MKITDDMLFEHAAEARNIWLSTLPPQDEIPVISYSKSFERKMRKLIKEQRRTPRTNQILRYMKQTAAAVLVIAVFTFGGLMTVDAYRAKVVEFVVYVFNELTQYRFSSNVSDVDDIILPEITFGYIPKGMKEIENKIIPTGQRHIVYENDTGGFFELIQQPLSENDRYNLILDTENSSYTVGFVHGCDAFFNTKGSDSSIVWIDGNMVYDLYGNIGMDELKIVAEKMEKLLN